MTLTPEVPPCLWAAVCRVATGSSWPPVTSDQAAQFVEQAKLHFLLPLLIRDSVLLPRVVQEALGPYRAVERLSRTHAQIQAQGLQRLLEILEGEDIVLLKGSDYGRRLYGDPGLRPMADVDILVPSHRIAPVCRRLEEAGLRRSWHGGPTWRVASAEEHVYLMDHVMVEAHQAFVQRPRTTIDYDAVWRRRVPVEGSRGVYRLDDLDAVVYHVLSMAVDEFTVRLIRYLDLWLLLREGGADILERAAARSVEWSCRHALLGALTLAGRVFPELTALNGFDHVCRNTAPAPVRWFLQHYVLPDPLKSRYSVTGSRVKQLWRKFWLMDSMLRRSAFLCYHAYASIAGRLAARG